MQVVGEVDPPALTRLLEQHLAVADDVVQRGVQLVAQAAEGGPVGGHGELVLASRASIFARSRSSSMGLVSKSSQPAASAFSRSPAIA